MMDSRAFIIQYPCFPKEGWWYPTLLLVVDLYTGIRPNEVIHLKKNDVCARKADVDYFA